MIEKTKGNLFMLNFMEFIIESIAQRVVEILKKEKEVFFQKTITLEAETTSESSKDRLLKINEVCSKLGISRATLNNWRLKALLLPDTYVGRSPRYFESTIDNYIQNNK